MTDQIDADILLSQQLEHAARFLRGVSDEDADACERAAERISARSPEPITSPLDLSALKALEEKATAGPWAQDGVGSDGSWEIFTASDPLYGAEVCRSKAVPARVAESHANMRFIAASRTALPVLIKRVEELEALWAGTEQTMDYLIHERATLQSRLATVERETVEKCAKVADRRAADYIRHDDDGASNVANVIAQAIRALAPPVTTKESGE